jgi:hypothetical protein
MNRKCQRGAPLPVGEGTLLLFLRFDHRFLHIFAGGNDAPWLKKTMGTGKSGKRPQRAGSDVRDDLRGGEATQAPAILKIAS